MYYIGVDIGGTFTDCVLVDRHGNHRAAKVLSTKDDPVSGVMTGLRRLAEADGLDLTTLLARTTRFGHGTTIGTNAVLERAGARVGLVATAGHGDALSMMRGSGRVAGRSIEDVFAVHGSRLPQPITVPGAVQEVHERIDASGTVVVDLDTEQAVEDITRMIAAHRLDSIAISLLWSFANAKHETALVEALAAAAPDVFVSSSAAVSPRLGEYERTVATVMNGYVGPACSRYLTRLAASLSDTGLTEPLLVMQSNGGVLPAEAAVATSLGTIDSGPAGGLTGVATLAQAYGHDRVVATDMGGTSFDIGLVIDGKPVMAEDNVIDQYTYRLPHLAVKTIACGGGTLARFDEATGGLRVGPQSAGSEPGPASYGRGGTEPTVTDADVVLGFLRPAAFLDGRMPLDRDAAVSAVGRLAEQLGMSLEETAAGILEINNMRAATVIRQQTLERGHDPRDYVLYAYGGAGPVHAFGYAAESGVREVIVPLGNGASTLSAYGIASGDVVLYKELERGLLAPFEGEQAAALAAGVAEVEAAARAELAAAGFGADVVVEIDALMRFREQLMHSLEIPVVLPADGKRLLADFDAEYVRRYGSGGTAMFQTVEVFAFRARASVAAGIPIPAPHSEPAVPVEQTEVYWPGSGWTPTAVHRGGVTGTVSGPALVELAHTTIAVPPGASLSTGSRNELRLQLPTSKES
ncbi:hydantoinase/oxoprolinase family protein [Amycolatopsis sp. FDAARGOS 1241]|uniref:hydantoinase/oxoprolinase family protein n=1 Tax=Amycolatopsis sp. FDAARGOS 1241 TaxID=2778070 RepID=UPI00194FA482|nr:hydantoinase/oxoprolinase family protein [Amycolatopsis sp. FDAARGOS 1241]QRP42951.1 hydantoinase/oxoprolinase family protein [Amycolatopsis sp. FDAARGOS 1241]